jgi:hypothetical protein
LDAYLKKVEGDDATIKAKREKIMQVPFNEDEETRSKLSAGLE